MITYYVDTSALVKRYVDETGSGWLRTALGTQPAPSIIIVHLATAVVVNRRLVGSNLAPLIFLSSDDRLNQAASAEGLAVDNPNHHP